MLRLFIVSLLTALALLSVAEPKTKELASPEGWGGETIALPPGFAPDMRLKGVEHIRFAPGMMKPASDSFFSYAFVFELEPEPTLTEAVLKEEFLKYYRGLCKSVLRGMQPEVDPSKFTLGLQRVKTNTEHAVYTGKLDWIEPFATKKAQQLHLEVQTWAKNDRNYIFVCVSPQIREAAIWKQLHAIRDDYLKK